MSQAERFDRVDSVAFDYGQRHRIELDCRSNVLRELRAAFPAWAPRLGEDHLIDLSVLKSLGDSALTEARAIEMQANGLPNTFVPARNLLFLTAAAALAYRSGAAVLVGGMCQTDYSGYPDCRDETIQAMQRALTLGLGLGLDAPLAIETPLMFLDKAATWSLAQSIGGQSIGRRDRRAHPHLLPRRARHAPRLGLRLRSLPSLRAARARVMRAGGQHAAT